MFERAGIFNEITKGVTMVQGTPGDQHFSIYSNKIFLLNIFIINLQSIKIALGKKAMKLIKQIISNNLQAI